MSQPNNTRRTHTRRTPSLGARAAPGPRSFSVMDFVYRGTFAKVEYLGDLQFFIADAADQLCGGRAAADDDWQAVAASVTEALLLSERCGADECVLLDAAVADLLLLAGGPRAVATPAALHHVYAKRRICPTTHALVCMRLAMPDGRELHLGCAVRRDPQMFKDLVRNAFDAM